MAKIKEVIGMDNHGEWANVEVMLDDGEIAQIWIGGDCEVYFHKGTIKAFVKRPTSGKVVD